MEKRDITTADLIDIAIATLKKYQAGGRIFGDVAAALLSEEGNLFTGVCVDTPSWGLCAERSALAAMITAREYRFSKIVGVWRDDKTGKVHVLPPCGHCREFMRNIDDKNLDAEIILGGHESMALRKLMPFHEWPKPLED